jgi:hypothetical protein
MKPWHDGWPLALLICALLAAIIPFGYWAALGGLLFLGLLALRKERT